jgi:hypothetical protein
MTENEREEGTEKGREERGERGETREEMRMTLEFGRVCV